jgi:chain length determinant protein tyrosine kinase EpsG
MTLQQFLNILWARWFTVALLFLLTVGAAVGVSLLLPRKYTASAQVLVDVKSPDPVLGIMLPAQMLPGYMATQVDIVSSPKVALMVVDRLRLAENPVAVTQWQAETGGQGSIRHHYAGALIKNLDVKPSRESSVMNIAYSGTDPQFAAVVANAFVRAYIDANVEIKVEPAKLTRGFFDEQAQAVRERLEDAQKRLTAYQREKGITSADERLDVENARLAELSSQLTVVQAQLVESAKRQQLAMDALRDGQASNVQEVLASPLVQQLKMDLARLEGKMNEQASSLGPNHPTLMKMRDEATSLKNRVAVETATIATSLGNQNQVVVKREQELRAALDKQRARVLQIKQVRDELAVLQREAEAAQRAFETIAQRLTQTSLESQSNQGNVVLLNPAVAPLEPSSPRLLLNSAMGTFLGTLLGVGGALGLELRRRRVRSADDLAQATELPVLGTIRRLPNRLREVTRSAAERSDRPLIDMDQGENTVIVDPSTDVVPASAALTHGDGRIVPDTAVAPPRRKKRIGEILVDAGLLVPADVQPILETAGASGVRFGEVAVSQRKVSAAQVRQALAFQFDFPVLTPGSSTVSGEVISAYDGSHALVADLRKLRTQILSRWLRAEGDHWPPRKAVAVVSPNRGDGKSFVAANLAVTFSQMGEKTLLIDADLRHGRLHEMFGMSNGVGLTALLNNQDPLGALRRVVGLRDLTLLSSGIQAPNPSDLLSREVFEFLLASFSKDYDVIIIDTPNATDEPDAELVARCAKACVIVGRAGRTEFDGVVALARAVEALGTRVLGTVFVDA